MPIVYCLNSYLKTNLLPNKLPENDFGMPDNNYFSQIALIHDLKLELVYQLFSLQKRTS